MQSQSKSGQKFNPIDYYDMIVVIDSMLSLKEGWKMKYSEKGYRTYLEKMNKRSCVVGVVGLQKKGKSSLLQKISGIGLPHGFSIFTEGLSVKYPTIEEKNIILLDSQGLETPLLFENPIEDGVDPVEASLILKSLIRNKQLTDVFLQTFVLFQSDIIIVVVGQLNYSDQRLISKIKADNLCKKKEKQKQLFVVHNLMHLERIEEVQEYTSNTLLSSFTFRLEQNDFIVFDKDPMKPKQNKSYFIERAKDIYGYPSDLIHIIMAKEGTEAGEFYNKPTINFIRNCCAQYTMINKFPLLDKIKEHLLSMSSRMIENPIEKEDIEVSEKGIALSIIRDIENRENSASKLKLSKCFIDEVGNSWFIKDRFIPLYSYYVKEDLLYFEIEIQGEVLDFKSRVLKVNKYFCFQFIGEKVIKLGSDVKESKSTREGGRFLLEVLISSSEIILKERMGIVLSDKLGVYTVVFKVEIIDDSKSDEEQLVFN